MVAIITPRCAMDLRQMIGTPEARGYDPTIMAILKMLGEIAQGGESVALMALTASELECINNPEESAHLDEYASVRQKIREATEHLARIQIDKG